MLGHIVASHVVCNYFVLSFDGVDIMRRKSHLEVQALYGNIETIRKARDFGITIVIETQW